ncbi:MAG: hypothetical protein M3N68_11665 [Actinomycetota bacterium]|nr:hypothetical protein [Actinomycetota bacterium]
MSRAVPAALAVAMAVVLGACTSPSTAMPRCQADGRLAVVAQSVPSASLVPCVKSMPTGWSFGGFDVESGRTRFWLDSDRAPRAVEVELKRRCDVSRATRIRSEEEGVRRYRLLRSLSPRFAGTTYDVFPGGCVAYRYEFDKGLHILLLPEFDQSVELFPRQALREEVRRDLGFDLDP